MLTSGKTKLALGLAVLLAAGSAGFAAAAWMARGEGAGHARAGKMLTLRTEDASSRLAGDLYPGGTGDLLMVWHNPNRLAVEITEITATGPFSVDPGHPGCVNHGLSFTPPTGLNFQVAGGESIEYRLEDAVSMAADADDGCEGAGFTLPVAARGIIIVNN